MSLAARRPAAGGQGRCRGRTRSRSTTALGLLPLGLLAATAACALLVLARSATAQVQVDRWPEFEVPPIPEDKDMKQIRLSRIRDGYLAVNTKTDPATTAELLVGDMLEAKGYSPEQVFAMQEVIGLLVKAGVVEVHADKLAAAGQSLGTLEPAPTPAHQRRHLSASFFYDRATAKATAEAATAAAAAAAGTPRSGVHRAAQECCPCSTVAGHHPKPPSMPHYNHYDADKAEAAAEDANAKASPAAPMTKSEKRSMYKTMRAVGLALRRAAAARSFYMYLTEDPRLDVHSMEEFDALSEDEQEATRKEVVTQLLLICKQYGLSGEELKLYAEKLGLLEEIPDLTDASKADLAKLGEELAAEHAMEKVATAMGKDLSWQALLYVREQVGDAMLKRIGIQPSPELDLAFANFTAEAQRFLNLSQRAMESQGLIEKQQADQSFFSATKMADTLASHLEGVNVTDVLITATQVMLESEPYLQTQIDHPVDPAAKHGTEPWRIILKLSKLEKAFAEQRRSFTVTLQPDNALDSLLLLNQTGQAADDPLMRELNMTAIADITADGMMDVDELAFLVARVGQLNEVYSVDYFDHLMQQVEANYRAMHGLPPAAASAAAATASGRARRRRR